MRRPLLFVSFVLRALQRFFHVLTVLLVLSPIVAAPAYFYFLGHLYPVLVKSLGGPGFWSRFGSIQLLILLGVAYLIFLVPSELNVRKFAVRSGQTISYGVGGIALDFVASGLIQDCAG
ncbi:hypothetical protein OQA88_12620 [Cercophora sp. LCS_1]